MSSKLEQVLNCSLEDYIAEKGIVAAVRPHTNDNAQASYFKRQLRSEAEDDEDEDDMFVEDRNGMDTTPIDESQETPKATKMNQQSEGTDEGDAEMTLQIDTNSEQRTFVTEEHKRGIKHMPSQQWRLLRQNQVSKKPAGIPPLKAIFDRNTEQLIASFGESARFPNADARNRINQRFNNQRKNHNFHHNNNNGHNHNHNNHNNRRNWNNRFRNQYGKNPNMAPSFNPNIDKMEHRANSQMANVNGNQIRDLRTFITPPSSFQSVVPHGQNRVGPPLGQPQLVTFADMLNRIGQASTIQDRDNFTDVIRNVMRNQCQQQSAAMIPAMNAENFSQMSSNELMPFAAQTLLNHISTVQQNFGPKYDMKVQKEIHTLQGKTMFYRSAGVVSTDGPGINNEHIKPVTTDVSMNMRFS